MSEPPAPDPQTIRVAPSTIVLNFPPEEEPGGRIGRYKLLQKLGEGGCGVVFLAEQEEPVKRRVALKIIKLGMDTRQVVARFEAERQALAMMDHPNIAKVLDAGATDAGRPFFVMELVRGIRITDYCDQNKLGTNERFELFIQVCSAIQHAHQKGIIHRDIKPSNVLVALNDGVPIPKVIDFGIAKATQQQLTDKTLYTEIQQFIGTPAYMSPEQAELSGLDIDTRSDVYSLGVLLYELLTGRTPFDPKELVQSGIDELRRCIREEEPTRPSTKLSQMLVADDAMRLKSQSSGVPDSEEKTRASARRLLQIKETIKLLRGDLDWIVMKCLEKDRTRRYEGADALAADLQRYLDHEPIMARPPSKVYRLRKLVKRNQAAVAAIAAVALALILGLIFSTWQYREKSKAYQQVVRAEREQKRLREEAEKARAGEVAQREAAEQARANEARLRREAQARTYVADMNLVQRSLELNNFGRASDLLNRYRPQAGQTDLRNWEWRYLWQQCRSDALFTLTDKYDWVNLLAVSADGKWLAIGEQGKGQLSVWDLRTRREICKIPGASYTSVAIFSPTKPLLALGIATQHGADLAFSVQVWDAESRKVLKEFPTDSFCVGIAFAADGETLVSITQKSTTVWRLADGKELASSSLTRGEGIRPYIAAISRDLRVAALGTSKGIQLIELASGKVSWSAPTKDQYITALDFSPDSRFLAMSEGYVATQVQIRDVTTGDELSRLEGHRAYILGLSFSADGKTLASASADQTIRLWNSESWHSKATLRGHRLEVWRVAWLPDNATLVSGCKDGSVMVWEAATPRRDSALVTLPDAINEWKFQPDNKSLLTVNRAGEVASWQGENFREHRALFELGTNVSSVEISQDCAWVAACLSNRFIQIWDVPGRTLTKEFAGFAKNGDVLRFPQTNRLFLVDRGEARFKVLSVPDFRDIWAGPADNGDAAAALSADGRHFVVLNSAGTARSWDLEANHETALNLKFRQPGDAAFSPDGKYLAVACKFGFARIWETMTWKETATLANFLKGVHSIAWAPDGRRLAVASGDKEAIKLWDVENKEELLTLEGPGGLLSQSTFSPDGNVLTSKDEKGLLHIWRAPSWDEIQVAETR